MKRNTYRVLAINPGSTSTKIAVFDDETCVFEETISHTKEDLVQYTLPGGDVSGQKQMRTDLVLNVLKKNHIPLTSLDAVSGRASRLAPVESGIYRTSEKMRQDLPTPLLHPAALGAVIAKSIGDQYSIPSFFVDPSIVDELCDEARMTGIPEIKRVSVFHALNAKEVGRIWAAENYKEYKESRLIVAHMGGGISVSAHRYGRAIDVYSSSTGEGPIAPNRTGNVPGLLLAKLCYSGKYTLEEMLKFFSNQGGFVAYTGVHDLREIEQRMEQGDSTASEIFNTLSYDVSRFIGSMHAVLDCKTDAILLTGGMANSKRLVGKIRSKVGGMAPVYVYPGEFEMQALAYGALRVLRGEELAKEYVGFKDGDDNIL